MVDDIYGEQVRRYGDEVGPPPDTSEPGWGDYAEVFYNVGLPEMAAYASSGVRGVAENQVENPASLEYRKAFEAEGDFYGDKQAFWQATAKTAKSFADIFDGYSQENYAQLNPKMIEKLETTVSDPEFWEAPVSIIAAQAARTAPTMLVPAAIGLVTPGGPFAAVALAAISGGALTAAQSVDEFYKLTDNLTDEELKAQSTSYRQYREDGLSEEEARAQFSKQIRGNKDAYLFAFGAITNGFGPAGQIVKAAKGVGGLKGGVLKRFAKGTGEAFVAEGAEEGVQDYTVQQAAMDTEQGRHAVHRGVQDEYDVGRTIDATIMGGLIGGALGGAPSVFRGDKSGRSRAKGDRKPRQADDILPEVEEDSGGTGGPPSPLDPNGSGGAGTSTAKPKPGFYPPNQVGNPQSSPTRSGKDSAKKAASSGETALPIVQSGAPDPALDMALRMSQSGQTISPVARRMAQAGSAPTPSAAVSPPTPPRQPAIAIGPATPPATQGVTPQPIPNTPPEQVRPFTAERQRAANTFGPAPSTEVAYDERAGRHRRVLPTLDEQGNPVKAPMDINQFREGVDADEGFVQRVSGRLGEVLGGDTARQKAQEAKEKAAAPKGSKDTTRNKKRVADNKAADDLFGVDKHLPDATVEAAALERGKGKAAKRANARKAVRARAKAMVDEAKAKGVSIPRQVASNTKKELNRSVGAMRLAEAAALAGNSKPNDEAIARFIKNDLLLRAGEVETYLANRRAEGDEKMSTAGSKNVEQQADTRQTYETSDLPEVAQAKDMADLPAKVPVSKRGADIAVPTEKRKVRDRTGKEKEEEVAAAPSEGKSVKLSPEEIARIEAEATESGRKADAKAKAKEEETFEDEAAPKAKTKETPTKKKLRELQESKAKVDAAIKAGKTEKEAATKAETKPSKGKAKVEAVKAKKAKKVEAKKAKKVEAKPEPKAEPKAETTPQQKLREADKPNSAQRKRMGELESLWSGMTSLRIKLSHVGGMVRRGANWVNKLPRGMVYGELVGYTANDGDPVDIWINTTGSKLFAAMRLKKVHVIDQLKQDGTFDEYKVFVGWPNKTAALEAYLKTNPIASKLLSAGRNVDEQVNEMTLEDFKNILEMDSAAPMDPALAQEPEVTTVTQESNTETEQEVSPRDEKDAKALDKFQLLFDDLSQDQQMEVLEDMMPKSGADDVLGALDSKQDYSKGSDPYIYHAVRNDEDIASIVENGLRPGTNVSFDRRGQAFAGEGETILVFNKDDVVANRKDYQDDGVVTNRPKPIAILKDTDTIVDSDRAFNKAIDEYNRLEAMESLTPAEARRMDKLLDRVTDDPRFYDDAFLAREKGRTSDEVLNDYKKHGLPVQRVKLTYNDLTDTTDVDVQGSLPLDSKQSYKKGWDRVGTDVEPRQPVPAFFNRAKNEPLDDYRKRTALQTRSFRGLMRELRDKLDDSLSGGSELALYGDIINGMIDRIGGLLADIPVYVLPQEAMNQGRMDRANTLGQYDQDTGAIAISTSVVNGMRADQGSFTLLHEGVHAAFLRALTLKPYLRESVRRIAKEAIAGGLNLKEYGLKDVDEFVAEAFSNPYFQKVLASISISPELRAHLDVLHKERGQGLEKLRSLWDATLFTVSRALGFKTARHDSLLGAIMEVGAHLEDGVTTDTMRMKDIDKFERVLQENDERQKKDTPFWAGKPQSRPGQIYAKTDDAVNYEGEFSDRKAAAGGVATKSAVYLMTTKQHARQFGHIPVFGEALRKISEYGARSRAFVEAKRDEINQATLPVANFQKKYKGRVAEEAANVMEELSNIEGTVVVGGDPKTIADDKINEHVTRQGKARLADLQRRFNKLPREGQAILKHAAAFYNRTHNDLARESITALVQSGLPDTELTPAQQTDIIDRTLNRNLREDDKAVLGEAFYNLLKKESMFHKRRGMYFPQMRYGDYVVTSKSKLTNTHGGKLLTAEDGYSEGNAVLFPGKNAKEAEAASHAFQDNTEFDIIDNYNVYLDDDNNIITKDEWDASDKSYTRRGHVVTVQLRGAAFFETRTEAQKYYRENPDGLDRKSMSSPQDRFTSAGPHHHDFSGTQVSAMNSVINHRTDIDDGTKTLLKNVVQQAAARNMRGNRISHRNLKRRKVAGASKDFTRNMLSYGAAASSHIATARTMPHIRGALRDMKKYIDEYEDGSFEGFKKNTLTQVWNEQVARVRDGIIDPQQTPKVLRQLMLISSFTRLGSLGYSIINGTQVFMLTAPYLGGRYGAMAAYNEIRRAYADMGFADTTLAGLSNTAKGLNPKNWTELGLTGTDNPVSNMLKRIARSNDGEALLDMIEEAIARGSISRSAGFEVSEAIMGGGRDAKVIARVDQILRQLPIAVEVINRTVSGVAAYRLAVKKGGMSHEKAKQFAIDTIDDTQGDYSNANAPRFFNHKWLAPAVQFRKYAQLYTYLMSDMTYRAFKNADPEERRIAQKQLAMALATQAAVAGTLSLPGLEFIKAGFMIGSALGLSGGWDEQEEAIIQATESVVGETWGSRIHRGVLTRTLGIDVSTRISGADLWTFGEPSGNSAEEIESYLFRQAFGSTGAMTMDWFKGVREIGEGDWIKGFARLMPLKTAGDTFKAIDRYSKGDINWFDATAKVVGLNTEAQAEAGREIGESVRLSSRREKQSRSLFRRFMDAKSSAEEREIEKEAKEFNKTAPLRYDVHLGPLKERKRQEQLKRGN